MGTGGSRSGAGRPGWRPKAEQHRNLDVRRFAAENMLRPGSWSWVWKDGTTGVELASIGVRGGVDRMTLSYQVDGEAVSCLVDIVKTECGFGGARPWFSCPRCARRVARLYMRAKYFACRHCQRLSYASQADDACGRTWRKQRRIEARLDENGQRPKHMHWRTYQRLLRGIIDCEEQREQWLAGAVARLMGGLEHLSKRFPGLSHGGKIQ